MKRIFAAGLWVLALAPLSFASIIDFEGGTAYLSDGTEVVTDNTSQYLGNVDYYIEDGIRVDFVGFYGIIGDYYGAFPNGENIDNAVLHAHWEDGTNTSIVFSKENGRAFDLNYLDLTSNTIVGGEQAIGTERSFITASNGSELLFPTSDWGIDYLYTGAAGDGIQRLWLDAGFDNIASFAVTSENAYCFGLDNFYIDEPPPVSVPEPATVSLLVIGLASLACARRRRK